MNIPFLYEEYTLLALLAGLLAIDDRAGWQSLLAQPVFAAMLVGAMLGEMEIALKVGVVLELVWLSHLPMRGTRRADTVAGAVIGTGVACILFRNTGDPRVGLLVAVGALAGLLLGQALGYLTRWLSRWREARIARFEIGEDATLRVTAQRLALLHWGAVAFSAITQGITVFVLLPLAVVTTEWLTGVVPDRLLGGATAWVALLPVLGISAVIHSYWQRHQNRFLVLSACILLVVLWIR